MGLGEAEFLSVGRMEGVEEPRVDRAERTEGAARGSTSMGMLGHLVRRRDWSLRWSFHFF